MKPRMGTEVVARKVRALIRCAVERWPVPEGVGTALRIAREESGYWPWAHSSSGCLGVFQQMDRYWPGRVESFLRREWFTASQWERIKHVPQGAYLARANVILSVRMARAGGWGPWSTY